MKRFLILCILCAFCGESFAASEIRAFEAGATTCYAVVREIDGDVWYVVGQAFEVWGTGGRTAADYDIALVNKTGGMFVGTMDTNIGAGQYYIVTHMQAGGSPADTDPAVWQDFGYWTGTIWTSGPDASDIDAILVDTGTTIPGLIAAISVDNGAIADEVVLHMDANSTDLNTLVAYAQEWDPNFTAILEDTGTTIPALIAALPTAAGVADAVWDEAIADHTGELTFGGELGTLDPNITFILADTSAYDTDAEHAAAIWNALMATYTIELSFGGELQQLDPNLTLVLGDTNELQTDWTDGGRLDLLLDDILLDTSTTLPASIAALVVPDPAGTAAALHATTNALIAGITVDNEAIAAAVHDEVVEGTITLRQALRLFLSVMTGKSSGGGTSSITFRDVGDTKNRLNVTVDGKGNRTAVNTRDGN